MFFFTSNIQYAYEFKVNIFIKKIIIVIVLDNMNAHGRLLVSMSMFYQTLVDFSKPPDGTMVSWYVCILVSESSPTLQQRQSLSFQS